MAKERSIPRAAAACASAWLAITAACEPLGPPPFSESLTLGGTEVTADTLNRGRRSYNTYCRACHGPEGDGLGPLGHQQRPRARDLRAGIIKFAGVASGSLPRDQDLARVIKEGLTGTAMLAWDVPPDEIDAVVQFIKSFSPRWQREAAGPAIARAADPWGGDANAAAKRGEEVYHALAQCISCHPAELPRERLPPGVRADVDEPRVTESSFGALAAPDLARATLRTGDTPAALYQVIAAGIGGTAMPTWKGALPERDLWALVHYIRRLRTAGPRSAP